MKLSVIFLSLLAGATIAQIPCIDGDLAKSIPDDSDFTILKAALEYVDFDTEQVIGDNTFTVLAPTNAAFAGLLDTLGVSSLEELSPVLVQQVLFTHIVVGVKVTSTDILAIPEVQDTPLPTVLEFLLTENDELIAEYGDDALEFAQFSRQDCAAGSFKIEVSENSVTFASEINEANLLVPDVELCGGIVHEIDTVLIPTCVIDDYDIRTLVAEPPMEYTENIVTGIYGGYGGNGMK